MTPHSTIHQFNDNTEVLGWTKKGFSFRIVGAAQTGKTTLLLSIANTLLKSQRTGIFLSCYPTTTKIIENQHGLEVKDFHSMVLAMLPDFIQKKPALTEFSKTTIQQNFSLQPFIGDFNQSATDYLHTFSKQHKTVSYCVSVNQQAEIIYHALLNFCQSSDTRFLPHHFEMPVFLHQDAQIQFIKTIYPIVCQVWLDFLSPTGKLGICPEVCIKIASLKPQQLNNIDFLIIDDAHTLTPAMLQIVTTQELQIIFAGDDCQYIYSSEATPFCQLKMLQLTLADSPILSSDSANHINCVRNMLAQPTVRAINNKTLANVYYTHLPDANIDAVVCRSDYGAFVEYINRGGHKQPQQFKLDIDFSAVENWLSGVRALMNEKEASHAELQNFFNWYDVIAFAEKGFATAGFRHLVYLVRSRQGDIPGLLGILNSAKNANTQTASFTTITTTRQVKGQRWRHVEVGCDFDLDLMTERASGVTQFPLVDIDADIRPFIKSWINWKEHAFPHHILALTNPIRNNPFTISASFVEDVIAAPTLYSNRYYISFMNPTEYRHLYIALSCATQALYLKNVSIFFILYSQLWSYLLKQKS